MRKRFRAFLATFLRAFGHADAIRTDRPTAHPEPADRWEQLFQTNGLRFSMDAYASAPEIVIRAKAYEMECMADGHLPHVGRS